MVLPMTILENVKELLGNPKNIDDKLNVIIELTQKRLGNLLSVKEVPEELEYIVIEVSVIRFNRIGSEGVSSHSVEGESMSFNDDDFDSYDKDIRSWLNNQSDLKKGSVRFLGDMTLLFIFKLLKVASMIKIQVIMEMILSPKKN